MFHSWIGMYLHQGLPVANESGFDSYLCLHFRPVKKITLEEAIRMEIYLLPLNGGCKSAGECQPEKISQDNSLSNNGLISAAH